jgi:DNA primase
MSVSTRGFFYCHRCQVKGWIRDPDSTAPTPPQKPQVVPEFELPGVPIHGSRPGVHDAAKRYLVKRLGKYAGPVAKAANLHVCYEGRFRNRIIVPYYRDGKLVGYQGRDFTGTAIAKYINATGMAREFWNYNTLSTSEWVLLVEGVFDAFRWWPNVVACGGKPTTEQIDILVNAKCKVIICLDLDASADNNPNVAVSSALVLERHLRRHGREYARITLPIGHDPGSVPEEWMHKELRKCLT